MKNILLLLLFIGSSVMSLFAQDLQFKSEGEAMDYATKLITTRSKYHMAGERSTEKDLIIYFIPDSVKIQGLSGYNDIPGVVRFYFQAYSDGHYLKKITGTFDPIFHIWGEFFNFDATMTEVLNYEPKASVSTEVKEKVWIQYINEFWTITNRTTY